MTMTDHIAKEQLEKYVMGSAEPAEDARLEAHVAACPACAKALAREARLEETLYEVAARAPEPAEVGISAIDTRPDRLLAAGSGFALRWRALWKVLAATPLAAAAVAALWATGVGRLERGASDPEPRAPLDAPLVSRPDDARAPLGFCPGGDLHGRCVRAAQHQGRAVLSETWGLVVPRYEARPGQTGLLVPRDGFGKGHPDAIVW